MQLRGLVITATIRRWINAVLQAVSMHNVLFLYDGMLLKEYSKLWCNNIRNSLGDVFA